MFLAVHLVLGVSDVTVVVGPRFAGSPPFTPEELIPILPATGKPDDEMGIVRKVKLVLLGLARAFRLYGSRPAVVDPRAINVGPVTLKPTMLVHDKSPP